MFNPSPRHHHGGVAQLAEATGSHIRCRLSLQIPHHRRTSDQVVQAAVIEVPVQIRFPAPTCRGGLTAEREDISKAGTLNAADGLGVIDSTR